MQREAKQRERGREKLRVHGRERVIMKLNDINDTNVFERSAIMAPIAPVRSYNIFYLNICGDFAKSEHW